MVSVQNEQFAVYPIASLPVSPVRMRTQSSSDETKILPSPIWPVWAALTIVLDGRLQFGVVDDDFDFHFRHEVDAVFRAAVHLGVAFLPAEAADLGDRHAGNAFFHEGVFDVLEFEVANNGFDFFHDW